MCQDHDNMMEQQRQREQEQERQARIEQAKPKYVVEVKETERECVEVNQ